jgi:nucleotide-binding universal stress UspA family protein
MIGAATAACVPGLNNIERGALSHMYKNILIATDGSDLAMNGVRNGVALAKSVGAKITAVTVSEPFHWVGPTLTSIAEDAIREGTRRASEAAVGAAFDAAKAANVDCEKVIIEDDFAYRGIVDTAAARNCDLIVMASHGRRGISAVILGSETVKVLTHAKIPVLVCH